MSLVSIEAHAKEVIDHMGLCWVGVGQGKTDKYVCFQATKGETTMAVYGRDFSVQTVKDCLKGEYKPSKRGQDV